MTLTYNDVKSTTKQSKDKNRQRYNKYKANPQLATKKPKTFR